MKKLQPTTQYKKDLKRYKNNPQKLADLKEVLKMLQNEQPIPNAQRNRPYCALKGVRFCVKTINMN